MRAVRHNAPLQRAREQTATAFTILNLTETLVVLMRTLHVSYGRRATACRSRKRPVVQRPMDGCATGELRE